MDDRTADHARRRVPALGRRDLMKLGAGVVATALHGPDAAAQGTAPVQKAPALTRAGYVNDARRAGGNGPMDETTRRIVGWVSSFSDANLTRPALDAFDKTMLDSIAALVTGFEEEHVRIVARLARLSPAGELKCTVMGYGISTTPELAAFVNSALVRATDFNDSGPGGHASDLIPGVLAVGEALHATGSQVMAAIAVGYECRATRAIGEQGSAALAVGKVMGLNEDQLANALSLALTPHVPLNKGEGPLSMWKGLRSAEAVKNGVWAALMAREGVTGPPQPFEGVGAQWARFGRSDVTLPLVPGRLISLELNGFKRRPVEASAQACMELIPEMRAWTRVEDIAAIHYRMPFNGWTEIADAPKFDPRNRETADHSMPYLLARALLDGDIGLDSFTEEQYMDPAARSLMAKMTFGPVPGWSGLGPARITIRKTTGEERTWDTMGGVRNPERGEILNTPGRRLSHEEIVEKFNAACAHKHVPHAQRDRARAVWSNLRAVRDIGEAIQTLATFGRPRPL